MSRELQKKYERVRKLCTLAGSGTTEYIKLEMVEYFQMFKKEYAKQLAEKEYILSDKG